MRRRLKIGWLFLAAVSIILSVWAVADRDVDAAEVTTSDGITYDDETYQLISYDSSVSTSVRIPDGVTTIPSNTNLFRDSGVTSVDLNGVTRIEAYAFRGSSLSSVTGDAVQQIGDQAFADTNLTTFSVPEGLTVLSQNAFRGTGITSFSGGGGNYRVYGGSIYSDSGATLYIVPEGKSDSVIVSDTATKIASGALSGATRVTDIYIPSSVTTIEDGATTGSGVIAPNGTIFGYTGTAAETYANSHTIRFSALNNSNSDTNNNTDNSNNANNGSTSSDGTTYIYYYDDDDDDDDDDDEDEDEAEYDDREYDVADDDEDDLNDTVELPNTGSGYAAANNHSLDTTPKTADGDIDPKFVFCVALFLIGFAGVLYTRQRILLQRAHREDEENDELD